MRLQMELGFALFELWKSCRRFTDYEVSSNGQVRRCTVRRGGPTFIGKLISQRLNRGYRRVSLYRGGKPYGMLVNRLVCEAFHGAHPPGDYEAAHWDGDRENNKADNLRWATPSENSMDNVRLGRLITHRGEDHTNAKLRNADIDTIFELRERGVTQRDIARRFAVCHQTIGRILRGERWVSVSSAEVAN